MIKMSFFRKLSTTQGVAAVLLRVVVLDLCTGVLAVITNIFYMFGNANVPIEELLWYIRGNHQVLDVLEPSELAGVGSGGTRVLPVEFFDGFCGIINVGD